MYTFDLFDLLINFNESNVLVVFCHTSSIHTRTKLISLVFIDFFIFIISIMYKFILNSNTHQDYDVCFQTISIEIKSIVE